MDNAWDESVEDTHAPDGLTKNKFLKYLLVHGLLR